VVGKVKSVDVLNKSKNISAIIAFKTYKPYEVSFHNQDFGPIQPKPYLVADVG
jgi:hypothetical protein